MPITVGKALERIHHHDYVLPAIQREFVWRTDQIARLFDSLLQGYPIGSFLFWQVDREHCREFVFYEFMTNYHQKNNSHLERLDLAEDRPVTAILDGQQRLTALNIGLRGSHAEKLPRKWADNLSAYPVRRLHLNIGGQATENELGMVYDLQFLTGERAASLNKDGERWFLLSDIVAMRGAPEIYTRVRRAGLESGDFAFYTLSRLHEIVHKEQIINFYEEDSQDLDKVLNIFIRVNSGGTTLSYSDLLLSIATAQWKDVEAKEVVHDLVEELNETGLGFGFSKDIVLKAGLVLTDIPSIAFRVTNFNSVNMTVLEAGWHGIAGSLRLAVQLLANFGFSERTLTATSVVIPIAYYLHQRHATESYLTSSAAQPDRDAIRHWAVRSLLKPGVWGSGLDVLLQALRIAIREHGASGFPVAEIESAMIRLGKSLRFEEDEIEDILGLQYGDKRVFPLLSLLYPGMNFKNEFHVDHIFPRALFKRKSLLAAGIGPNHVDDVLDLADRLPNLQLLEGPINVAKQDKLPTGWLAQYLPDAGARDAYRAWHDLGSVPDGMAEFRDFFAARQQRIGQRLRKLLGVGTNQGAEAPSALAASDDVAGSSPRVE